MLRWMLLLLVLANALVWLYFQSWLAPLGLTPPPPTAAAAAEAPVTELAPEALRLLPAQPATATDASVSSASSTDNGTAAAPASSQDDSNASADAATPAAASSAADATSPSEPANTAVPPAPPTQATPANAPAESPIAQTKPAAAGVCWEARGLSPEQARALGPTGNGWALETVALAERWIVYIGPLPGEAMNRRRGELRQAKIDFRRVDKPGLAPGLALATVASEAEGQGELRRFKSRGVRDVQLKKERDATSAFTLRLAQGSNAERDALAAKLGQALVRCR